MITNTTSIRKLQLADLPIVKAMQTNIADDYVIEIFDRLVSADEHALYGLFVDNQLTTIAGYSVFPGGYAMLGRLRSDVRNHGKGNATLLLNYLIDLLRRDPLIKWIGGNTNIENKPARRVLDKLGFSEVTTFHALPLANRKKLQGVVGPVWQEISSLQEKRAILTQLAKSTMEVYPYECYYPFPFRQALVPDHDLALSHFYQNPTADRWVIIKKDFKKEAYAHVKYFWDDHFKQAGLFETIDHFVEQDPENPRPWLDFTTEGYQNIPDISAFELSDGWVLYGDWVTRTGAIMR